MCTDPCGTVPRQQRVLAEVFILRNIQRADRRLGKTGLTQLNPIAGHLQVREDLRRGAFVEGITEETVTSAEEALMVLKRGARNRHVGETEMNSESSRSHSVFTLTLESKQISEGVTTVQTAKFHFVDLAGSERQKATAAAGARLREAGNINKSLTVLGSVINSLVDASMGKKGHIRYRDSKLTFLLKDSLGGNSKTSMVANISPASIHFGETLSTLKFAQRAKLIKNNASINEEASGSVEGLKKEIARLKKELEMARTDWGSSARPNGDPSSSSEHLLRSDTKPARGSSSSDALSEKQRFLMEFNASYIELEYWLQDVLDLYQLSLVQSTAASDKLASITATTEKFGQIVENRELHMKMIIDLYTDKFRRINFNSWTDDDERNAIVRENVGQ